MVALELSVVGFVKHTSGSIVRSKEGLDIRDVCMYTKGIIGSPVQLSSATAHLPVISLH